MLWDNWATDFRGRVSASGGLHFLIAPESHEHGRYGGRPTKRTRRCSLWGKSDNAITMSSLSRFELEARYNRPIFSREIEVKSSGNRSMFVRALACRVQSFLSRAVADSGRVPVLGGSAASCRHRLLRHRADEKEPEPKAVSCQAFRSAT